VSLQIEIPAAGLFFFNEEPFRIEATIGEIPPYGDTYASPAAQPPIPLFDQFGVLAGQIISASQDSPCPSDADCIDDDPCTLDSCDTVSGYCIHDAAAMSDTDGDGVCDAADNCPMLVNSGGQAPRVFEEMIVAPNKIEFCWTLPADIIWVEGDLGNVSTYPVVSINPGTGAICFVHGGPPLPDGSYYLVRDECLAGSWQSSLGVEQKRDEMLP
jgi:hypothetical protein